MSCCAKTWFFQAFIVAKILLLILLLMDMLAVAILFHIRINLSHSMPIGLYQKINKAPELGDTVAVCLSEPVAREGLDQGYLLPGYCPSKMLPVLKMLIAVPGDTVVVTEKFMLVNDQKYDAPQQLGVNHFDGVPNSYWSYGSNAAERSWDSRYFGGVDRKSIIGVYKPLLVFA